ncbi:hypothetical protein SNE40_010917 [Patella caerulea]|uniref:Uncharacterized protein n=1 Tax=Patella caerulea TaxID=87958 RepID=A0AAN8PVB8_PATCE
MASACVVRSTKSARGQCFICKKEKHHSNLYKLYGSRARDGKLFVKLGYFFDEELLRSVRNCCDDLVYCKTCETQINNCHKFINLCHEVFTEVASRKRSASTPVECRVNPQMSATGQKRRKLLTLGEEECSGTDSERALSIDEPCVAMPSVTISAITLPQRYKKLDPQSQEAVAIEETAKVIGTFANAGLYYRDLYVSKPNVTAQEIKELKDVLSKHQLGSYDELVRELMEHDKVKNAIQKTLLMSLDKECTVLCGKRASSILRTCADLDKLKDGIGTIGYKCLDEMEKRYGTTLPESGKT